MLWFKQKWFFLAALSLLIGFGTAYAAGRLKLLINGVVASTHVITFNGEAYVPVKDVARALNMKVMHSGSEYNLSRNSGSSFQAAQNAAQRKTLPLTNIPAKVEHSANNLVVVNNEKANILNMPAAQWISLSNTKAQGIANNWKPPMTISGQTYGSGYMFLFYGSPGDHETLTYWLKGRHYSTLTADLGFDDHVQGDTASAFKVSFLGNGRLLKSIQVSGSNNPARVKVPISGILTLKIKVKLSAPCSGCYPALDIVNPTLSK